MKMAARLVAALCLLHLFSSSQALDLDMMPDAFDDQYIGCVEKMEREMPKILEQEKKYQQFATMWDEAKVSWGQNSLKLPETFKAEYGVAVVLYTMEKPYPIYSQLNGDISIAGRSRDYYMNNFHFKALHFYLTRALQVLGTGCGGRLQVYRGTELGDIKVSPELRFGRFTSSSLQYNTAATIFGKNPMFSISTCFGVDIADLSDFEEQEVLIPVPEKFKKIQRIKDTYELKSTGQLCSYFNCAYLGGEKRKEPVCNSAPGMSLYYDPRTPLIFSGLTVILDIVIINLFCCHRSL